MFSARGDGKSVAACVCVGLFWYGCVFVCVYVHAGESAREREGGRERQTDREEENAIENCVGDREGVRQRCASYGTASEGCFFSPFKTMEMMHTCALQRAGLMHSGAGKAPFSCLSFTKKN